MNEIALFAGVGGGILGGILGGKSIRWRTVCAVEIDDYCRRVLMQRQDDGLLEPFPIWPDIRTFDARPWAGCVDIVTGGFPCHDISTAGRGAGIEGNQSRLWYEMARVIREVRPRHILVENSPALTIRGLGRILGDLAEMGFDAEWGVLGADDVGAPHIRKRIWILADAARKRARAEEQPQSACGTLARGEVVSDAHREPLWDEPGRGGGADRAREAELADYGAQGDVADAHGAGCEREGQAQPAGPDHPLEPVGAGAEIPDADGFDAHRSGPGDGEICRRGSEAAELCDPAGIGLQAGSQGPELGDTGRWRVPAGTSRWPPEPNVVRGFNGFPFGMDLT